jgi:hypothetical protein
MPAKTPPVLILFVNDDRLMLKAYRSIENGFRSPPVPRLPARDEDAQPQVAPVGYEKPVDGSWRVKWHGSRAPRLTPFLVVQALAALTSRAAARTPERKGFEPGITRGSLWDAGRQPTEPDMKITWSQRSPSRTAW